MSTTPTITSHMSAILTLAQTQPSIAAPVETLIRAVREQADDLARDRDLQRKWAREAEAAEAASLKARHEAEAERDQARRELATAKTEITHTATVDLLKELAGSPAKLLLVLREAGWTVGVRDLAGGTPALAEDEIAILSDPAQHGPSVIAVLVKV